MSGIADKSKELPFVLLGAPSIAFSTTSASIMLMMVIGVMPMAWERIFCIIESRDTVSASTNTRKVSFTMAVISNNEK